MLLLLIVQKLAPVYRSITVYLIYRDWMQATPAVHFDPSARFEVEHWPSQYQLQGYQSDHYVGDLFPIEFKFWRLHTADQAVQVFIHE